MKQYILDALSESHHVVLYFGNDDKRTFTKLLNSYPNNADLIELCQDNYGAYLINLNHVRYVEVQKAIR